MHIVVLDHLRRCDALWSQVERVPAQVHRAENARAALRLAIWELQAVCIVHEGNGATALEAVDLLRRRAYCGPVVTVGAQAVAARMLDSGSDDVVAYEVTAEELVARIRTIARRSGPHVVGELVVDPLTNRSWSFGRELNLRPRDAALLAYLATRPERHVRAKELIERLWGSPVGRNVVDVAVWRIRQELGNQAWMLKTERRSGYSLSASPVARDE